MFKTAVEEAFSEVAPDDIVEVGVVIHSQIPTLQPTIAVRRRLDEEEEETDDIMEGKYNLRNNMKQFREREFRQLAVSTVDLDVTYGFTIVSSETSVDSVTSDFNSKMTAIFTGGGIYSYLTSSSASLNIPNNATMLIGETSNLLSVGSSEATLIVLNTASPTFEPTLQPSFQPTSLEYFGLTTVVTLSEGVAVATTAVIGASVGASIGTSSSTISGDPLSLILLVQGIAITSKLSSLPDSYGDSFASSFSMFNLQVYQNTCNTKLAYSYVFCFMYIVF